MNASWKVAIAAVVTAAGLSGSPAWAGEAAGFRWADGRPAVGDAAAAVADQQLDEFLSRGSCEFLDEYARPFSGLVIA